MNDIDLSYELLKPASYNMVVPSAGAHPTHETIRNAKLSSFQGRAYFHTLSDQAGNRGRKDQDVSSSLSQSVHLMPSRSADPLRS